MSSASEYKEDARRIERDYVDPSSTSRGDIESDLKDADFGNPGEIADWMMDETDVGLDSSNTHLDGVTTREEVERAVNEADDIGYSSDRREALTDAVSKDVGAPRESDLRSAQFQALSQESVTPGEVIEGDSRRSQISVVRNMDGDPVATIGGGGSAGRDVAEALGATHYSSPQQFNDSMSAKPAPDGREALLYSDDEAVGRVDL